jgi:uncharacterized Zn finger protein
MAHETTTVKAARLFASGHVRVIRASDKGIALDVLGDSTDAFSPLPYRVMRYVDAQGVLTESCTCPGGQAHPIRPRCSHMAAARLLWVPPCEGSGR